MLVLVFPMCANRSAIISFILKIQGVSVSWSSENVFDNKAQVGASRHKLAKDRKAFTETANMSTCPEALYTHTVGKDIGERFFTHTHLHSWSFSSQKNSPSGRISPDLYK